MARRQIHYKDSAANLWKNCIWICCSVSPFLSCKTIYDHLRVNFNFIDLNLPNLSLMAHQKFGGDWTVVYSRIYHFAMLCRTSACRPVIITNSNKSQLPIYENNKLLRHQKLCSKRRKLLYALEHHPVNQLDCQADLQTDPLFKQFLRYDKRSQYL